MRPPRAHRLPPGSAARSPISRPRLPPRAGTAEPMQRPMDSQRFLDRDAGLDAPLELVPKSPDADSQRILRNTKRGGEATPVQDLHSPLSVVVPQDDRPILGRHRLEAFAEARAQTTAVARLPSGH